MHAKSVLMVALSDIWVCCFTPTRGLAWEFITRGSSDYGFSQPAVSGGDVAYTYYGGPDGASIGVYGRLADASIVRTGDAAPIGIFTGLGPARISDGTVAFGASYSGGASIFTKSGGTLATIATIGDIVPSTSSPIEGFGDIAISGLTVAFQASYGGGSQQAVFTGSGGPLTTVAKVGDVTAIGALTQIDGSPRINGATVAFSATLDDGMTSAVFAGSGGALTTICKTGDAAPVGSIASVGVVGVGASGKVAVWATYDGGTKSGIFTSNGGALTPIVKTGDVVPGFGPISSLGAASVSGDVVAFLASDGIFTANFTGPIRLACRTGDLPGLSYPYSFSMGPFGLGGDRLAIYYSVSVRHGNHIGILTIPEPATIALAGVGVTGASGFLLRRRTKKNSIAASRRKMKPTQLMFAMIAVASATNSYRPASAGTVYSNDFNGNPSEWSPFAIAASNGESFLASSPNGFGNQTVTLTLTDLPPHGMVTLGFDLYLIQSWDGNGEQNGGPDNWQLTANGANLLFTNFANYSIGNTQAYPNQLPPYGPGGMFAPRTGAFENGHLGFGLGGFGDSTYRFSLTFPQSASTLVLAFRSFQNEGVDNEGWGLDNVTVDVSGEPMVPEPGVGALIALGTFGFCAMARRASRQTTVRRP